jgi:hypothetical protein
MSDQAAVHYDPLSWITDLVDQADWLVDHHGAGDDADLVETVRWLRYVVDIDAAIRYAEKLAEALALYLEDRVPRWDARW